MLYALGAIRNVGEQAMAHVVEVRRSGGAFTGPVRFPGADRSPSTLNKRALENLARAGAFDSIHPNRASIVASADVLIAYAQTMAEERTSRRRRAFGFDSAAAPRGRGYRKLGGALGRPDAA